MAAPACFVFNRVFLDESFMKFRITPALFKEAETVLAQVLRFDRPADAVLSHYFRLHRQLGHADRGFVAETVFAFLRRRRSLEAVCSAQPDHRQRLLATLVLEQVGPEVWSNLFRTFEQFAGPRMSTRDRIVFQTLAKRVQVTGTVDDPHWRPENLPKELFLIFD